MSLLGVFFDNLLQGILLRNHLQVLIEVQGVAEHVLEARRSAILIVQLDGLVRHELFSLASAEVFVLILGFLGVFSQLAFFCNILLIISICVTILRELNDLMNLSFCYSTVIAAVVYPGLIRLY